MVAQSVLPYQYQEERSHLGLTGLAGLPVYLDLAHVAGLRESIECHVGLRKESQGWTDSQLITSMILLNLCGGDCVEDLEKLESDAGFSAFLKRVETHGMPRSQRRSIQHRWRRARTRSLPSASALRRYLALFDDPGET